MVSYTYEYGSFSFVVLSTATERARPSETSMNLLFEPDDQQPNKFTQFLYKVMRISMNLYGLWRVRFWDRRKSDKPLHVFFLFLQGFIYYFLLVRASLMSSFGFEAT